MNLRTLGLAGIIAASTVFGGCDAIGGCDATNDRKYMQSKKAVTALYGDYDKDGIVTEEETRRLMGDIAKKNRLVYFIEQDGFYDSHGPVSTKKIIKLFKSYNPENK